MARYVRGRPAPEYIETSCGKRGFMTPRAAEAVAKRVREKDPGQLGWEVRTYRCRDCTYFHVGHRYREEPW